MFNQHEVMEEFDRIILDTVIEKVVVGSVDDEGNPLPYSMTFVLKAGLEFNDEILEMLKKETLGPSQAQAFSFTENEVEKSCSSTGYLP